jgi:hypothetical protein
MSKSIRRPRIAALLVALALVALPSALVADPASAAGGTVWVNAAWTGATPGTDPDGGGPATNFGVNAFATITTALAVAPDTVNLAAGTYPEQVLFSSSVTVHGAGAGLSIIANPGSLTAVHTLGAIVVAGAGASVTMTGVTIAGPGVSNPGPFNVGVLVVDGGALDLRSSTVTAIRDTPLGGTQTGNGVVVGSTAGQGGASNGSLHLEGSTISDFQKIGVIVRAGSTATILDNDFVGQGWQCVNASNGIQVQGTATIAFNRVTANSYYWCGAGVATSFGIGVFSPSGDVDIHDNSLTGNEIGLYFSAGAGVLSTITATDNAVVGLEDDVSGHVEADDSYGVVSVWAGPNLAISENSFTRHHYGLFLAGGGETVTSNTISANVLGVQASVSPIRFAGNAIVGNTAGADGVGSGGPNWWGCNEGPTNAACDSATGYTEADWLVLSLALPACEVTVEGIIPATLSLATTSGGLVTVDAFVPPTAITPITGNNVEPTPAAGMTTDGVLTISLTGMIEGAATLQAQAENALVAAPSAGSGCPLALTVLPAVLLATSGVEPLPLLAIAVLLTLVGLLVRRFSY